jgi:hypothetical protein
VHAARLLAWMVLIAVWFFQLGYSARSSAMQDNSTDH